MAQTQYTVYLVETETGRVISRSQDDDAVTSAQKTGELIDPSGDRNIRISFAYGEENVW